MTDKPMTVTDRNVTIRDFLIFQVKLVLDGGKDFFAFWFSIGAIVLDFVAGRGRRPRLFYSVVRASERFDRWLNLHSVVRDMDESGSEEGLFGGVRAGSDTFIAQIERYVRKDEDLGRIWRELEERGRTPERKDPEAGERDPERPGEGSRDA